MLKNKAKKNFTEGPIVRALLNLSIPIVLTNILQSGYQLTDMFWVGRINETAVAAVSLSYPLMFLLTSLGAGFAVAGTVLVSQYSGSSARDKVDLVVGQSFSSMSIFSILISIVGYYFTPQLITIMGATNELFTDTKDYLQISLIGLFFTYSYMMFQSLFRGVGNVRAPLILVIMGVTINFILDPLFIMGYGPVPAMGVKGAAYATVGTQGFTALFGMYLISRGNHGLKLHFKNLSPIGNEVSRIIKLGLPASIEQSTRALSMLMITFLVTSFGVVGTAAYGVGARVLSFVIIPALGFSLATSTVVGQNVGAGKFDRAHETAKAACIIIFLTLTTVGLFTFTFAHGLMEIFVPNSPLVQDEGANFIRTISLTFGLIGFQQVVSGALRGGGSTLLSMILAMATLWIFRFPIAYVLSHHTQLGIKGVWWAFGVSNLIAGVLSWYLLFKTKWMKNLTHSDQDDLTEEQLQTLEETKVSDTITD